MTFMDDYYAGRTDGCDIDDHIERWHSDRSIPADVALHDYLGMTLPDYIRWFNEGTLPERGAP